MSTVPCETCGTETPMTGTKRCDWCWEVEHRLAHYLNRGGAKAAAIVRQALAAVEPLKLYSIEERHLERLMAVVKKLREAKDGERALDRRELIQLAYEVLTVIRYAETLSALQGPGEAQVHICPSMEKKA